MRIKTSHIAIISLFTVSAIILISGFKSPPEILNAADISPIKSVSIYRGSKVELTQNEIEYWNHLDFEITKTEYPGETPDLLIDLITENDHFTAMYNEGDDIVFFSFVSEVKYGFFNSPPPGGWTQPLYKAKATDELLNLLKIKYRIKKSD